MMKVLVTGANGFIGANVVKTLCSINSEEIEIIATDLYLNNIIMDKKVTTIQFNLFDNCSNDNLSDIFHNPDIIIHLAYRNGFVHNHDSHIEDLSKHIKLIQNFQSFPNLKSLSIMGTMHEIGYYEGAINANTPCWPTNFYGIAKNALRQFVTSLNTSFQVKWLRAYYIYDNKGSGNSIFSKIFKASQSSQVSFPLTSGINKCDYIELETLSKQIVAASLQNKFTGIINVCSGIPMSLKDAVTHYIHRNNIDINFEFNKFPDRPYDSPIVYGDAEIINEIMKNTLYFK